VDHLLVGCVFARQFWFQILCQVGLHSLAPQPNEQCFDSWWQRLDEAASGLHRDGINTLVILGSWMLWNHRNRCVFDGAAPSLAGLLAATGEERRLWSMTGARGLNLLTAAIPEDQKTMCVLVALY
jgi:hypothetical protein